MEEEGSNFFKTEILHSTDKNNKQHLYGDFARIERNKHNKQKHETKSNASEKFKPEISRVHMLRTPTPSDGTRGHQTDEPTSDTSLIKFLSMRKIARQVRNAQITRQRRLDYTGNETIEHKVRKFLPGEVEPILYQFLKDNLEYFSYDPQECRDLSKELSEELREVIKSLKYPRYKFIAMVTIGQTNRQTVTISSRALCDTNMDTYVSAHFTNDTLFAVATVFAMFLE